MFSVKGDRADFLVAARMTTAAVPHRPFVPKVKRGDPGVWRLLIIVEMVAPASERHARRKIRAEPPAGDIERMNAIVAEFAVAPVPAPMPVVVHEIVNIR